jgi:hypothetical protein
MKFETHVPLQVYASAMDDSHDNDNLAQPGQDGWRDCAGGSGNGNEGADDATTYSTTSNFSASGASELPPT